ncbi:MAG TPA: DUF4258 domain-containing protein [Solirubrobacteraceae bacterium]|nr:DUF4258 domain-containing protein [Solirubrobacteraceae bacterium]
MSEPASEMWTNPDPHGRELPEVIWQSKILRDHPEMAGHREAVLRTVATPEHVEDDPLPRRRRYYRRSLGPNRWLLVVVTYEQDPARIITALGNRKDPKQWTP